MMTHQHVENFNSFTLTNPEYTKKVSVYKEWMENVQKIHKNPFYIHKT